MVQARAMAWTYFFLLTLFWGCSFLAIRLALDHIPPFAAAAVRILLAGAILGVAAIIARKRFPSSKALVLKLMGIGVVNFGVSWACLFWGEQYVLPAVASIVNSAVPLIVFVLSLRFLKHEKPGQLELVSVGVGFLGILLVFVPSIQVFSLNQSVFFGMVAVFVMSLAYGIGTVMIRRLGATVDGYWSFVLQAFPAGVFLSALSLSFEPLDWVGPALSHPKAWLGILYLAVFSSALAWLMYFKLLHTWGALRTSSVTYAMPVVSIVVDWLFLKRLPTFYQLIGAALILQAIYMMRWAQTRKVHAQSLKSVAA